MMTHETTGHQAHDALYVRNVGGKNTTISK